MSDPAEWAVEGEVQEALARLWTDERDRARFLSDRVSYLASLPISGTARERLSRLDAEQVAGFATSLVQKRLEQARELLADIAARMPGEFDSRFSAWAATHPPAQTRHHEEDARQFGRTLLAAPLTPELRDRLRWRLLRLGHHRKGWRLGITWFRHDIRDPASEPLLRRDVIVVWWSLPGLGRGLRATN